MESEARVKHMYKQIYHEAYQYCALHVFTLWHLAVQTKGYSERTVLMLNNKNIPAVTEPARLVLSIVYTSSFLSRGEIILVQFL